MNALRHYPEAVELIERISDQIHFEAYSADDVSIDGKLMAAVFEAFMDGGRDAAEQVIVDGYDDASAGSALYQIIRQEMKQFGGEVEELVENSPALRHLSIVEVEDQLYEAIAEVVAERDTSKPFDMIPQGSILVAYIPGHSPDLGIEDQSIRFVGWKLGQSLSIVPSEAARAFFEFANISKQDWLAHVQERDEVNLETGAGLVGHDAEVLAEVWSKADWPHDPSRPALLGVEDADTILENTDEGAVPALFVKLDLRKLVSSVDPTLPFTLEPGRKGNVGEFGLFQFVSGGGHVDAFIRSPVTIAPGGRWIASEARLRPIHGLRAVCDPVEAHLEPVLKGNISPQILGATVASEPVLPL